MTAFETSMPVRLSAESKVPDREVDLPPDGARRVCAAATALMRAFRETTRG